MSTTTSDEPVVIAATDATALSAILASGHRPARPGPFATSMTFGWRTLLRIKHVPEQLFDVTAFPVMMTLMFTFLFGGALGGSVNAYLQFFLPGILVSTVVMITMYTGLALNTDIEKGVFDRFRSLPIWRPSALVGALLGDAVRYTIAAAVVLTLGIIIGFRPEGSVVSILAAIALLLVFSFSLSWVWTLFGLIMRSQNAVMGVSMMAMFPLTFISNIYVDPSTMPGWLQGFVDVNPISHLVSAVRELMQGGWPVGEIVITLGWSAALVAVFGPLTMRRYYRKN